MNSSTIDILVPSAFLDHYTTVQTTELTYTMTVAEHQLFLQTNAIPVHLNTQPCTLEHTIDHTCPPCTEDHDNTNICELQHLADHICPPVNTPCELDHAIDHTCPVAPAPAAAPCNLDHIRDHTCPTVPTPSEIVCSQTHFNPLFHQRIPLTIATPTCQREHLDHHACTPTPCLFQHYPSRCTKEHLSDHTCPMPQPTPMCTEQHLRDHTCPSPPPRTNMDPSDLPIEILLSALLQRVQKPIANPTSGDLMYQSDEHRDFYEAFTSIVDQHQFFSLDDDTPTPRPSSPTTAHSPPPTPKFAYYADASTSIDFDLSYPPNVSIHSEFTTDSEILAQIEHPAQMLNPLRKVERYLATTTPSLPPLSEYSTYAPSETETDDTNSLPQVAEMHTIHPFPSTSLLAPRLNMELNNPSENPDSPFFQRQPTHSRPTAFSLLKAPHLHDAPTLPGPSSPFGRLNLNVQQAAELPPRPLATPTHQTTIDQPPSLPRPRAYDIRCLQCAQIFRSLSESDEFCSVPCEFAHADL